MSSPYPEVTVVNLPSSFMIVSSLTPSYSLLAYLFQFLGTVLSITIFIIIDIWYLLLFPEHFALTNVVNSKKDLLIVRTFR